MATEKIVYVCRSTFRIAEFERTSCNAASVYLRVSHMLSWSVCMFGRREYLTEAEMILNQVDPDVMKRLGYGLDWVKVDSFKDAIEVLEDEICERCLSERG